MLLQSPALIVTKVTSWMGSPGRRDPPSSGSLPDRMHPEPDGLRARRTRSARPPAAPNSIWIVFRAADLPDFLAVVTWCNRLMGLQRDVREAASHADPRTTIRYDRGVDDQLFLAVGDAHVPVAVDGARSPVCSQPPASGASARATAQATSSLASAACAAASRPCLSARSRPAPAYRTDPLGPGSRALETRRLMSYVP
jgi:hypothetical protein